jgi:D-methionine transport system ATP-binding protein
MISIQNVTKTFLAGNKPVKALDNINIEIKQGEIFGIIGRSGAGKSTLIRCVNLLERPDSGVIQVNKQNLTTLSTADLRKARRQIGMIFQHFNLLKSKTVFENIALPMQLNNEPKALIQARVHELLKLTELSSHKDHYPSQLSGGQKQRVAIARALVHSPKVLLSDEATSALDPRSTQSIFELLKTINKELGITILLITHEMDVVKAICDRVAVIHHGGIIEEQPVLDLFTSPQTQMAKDFVKTAARMDIPKIYKHILHEHPSENSTQLIRIAYKGNAASEPIITHLIKKFDLSVNIIQANMEVIQDQMLGLLIVELQGKDKKINQGLTFLEESGLIIERLGYVH